MSTPNQPVGGAHARRVTPGATHQDPPARRAGEAGGTPAFQVLLERLQRSAQSLEASSKALDDPSKLAGAVDIARTSLDDALSLGDQLLEAFREASTQPTSATPKPTQEDPS